MNPLNPSNKNKKNHYVDFDLKNRSQNIPKTVYVYTIIWTFLLL